MLIEFRVGNFKSFNSEQTLSLRAGKYSRHNNHLILFNGNRYLKCGVLFGANASGKTNLINAISFLKEIVINGTNPSNIMNKYFRLDNNAINIPGYFDIEIESNGKIYNYGISVSYLNNSICGEWLYQISNGRKLCVFFRKNGEDVHTDINIRDVNARQRFQIYAEDVFDSKTLLCEVTSHRLRDVEAFKAFFDVYDWIEKLIIIYPESVYGGYNQFFINDNSRNSLERMLSYFDTGIESIIGDEKSIDETLQFLPENVRNEIAKKLLYEFEKIESGADINVSISINNKRISISRDDDGNLIAHQLMMSHGNNDNLFDIEDESDGTRRLLDLIPIYSRALEGCTIFIDELDRSFHTKLTEEFINKFFSDNSNNKSQLIFTTHDTNLMSLEKFRQDEIWFMEKEKNNGSKLYSLQSFNERFDKDVMKEYLQNKYGAVPVFAGM